MISTSQLSRNAHALNTPTGFEHYKRAASRHGFDIPASTAQAMRLPMSVKSRIPVDKNGALPGRGTLTLYRLSYLKTKY